jgi:transposase
VSEYSEAFKSKMVQRMMGPRARTANALGSEVGISQPTLSRWLRAAQANLGSMSKVRAPPLPSPSAPKSRRAEDWPAEERLRVVAEAGRLSDAELGAFLRREGLHEATLREWRAAALEGLSSQGMSRSKKKRGAEQKRVRELERQLRRKDKALAETAALLVLQKKVQAIWGDGDDDTEPRNDE